MKIIKYIFCDCIDLDVNQEEFFNLVTMPWSETNEEIAKREAYNGEYEIIDDGIEPVEIPSETEKLDARLTYIEMMTGLMEV